MIKYKLIRIIQKLDVQSILRKLLIVKLIMEYNMTEEEIERKPLLNEYALGEKY